MITRQAKQFYEFGPFRVDVSERVLQCDGRAIPLAPKVFDTLLVLVEHSGHLLEKDELMRAIWLDVVVEEVNLAHNISVLRKVFANDDAGQSYIETVPKRGYRFTGSVREVSDAGAEVLIAERTRSSVVIEEQDEADSAPRAALAGALRGDRVTWWSKSRFLLSALAGSVMIVGLALAAFYFWRASRPAPPQVPQANSALRSIAVLPFTPLVAERRDESFELGMADTLITKLSHIRQIVVRPIGSVRKYAGLEQDPLAAGREQQVDAVLEGSMQWDGERVRVSARLLRVGDGAVIWSDQCVDQCADIFAVQDAISERITEALALTLAGDERQQLVKRYTDKAEAYRLYLLGRYHWNKRTDDGLSRAMAFFRQAIDLDPNYALAYAGIADCYIVYGSRAQLHPREALLSAQAAATRALQIDEQLAEAHASLGVVRCRLDWNWPEAEREFKRALELDPGYATAHQWYAIYFEILGRPDEAIRQAREALELDPVSPTMNAGLAHRLYYARQYALAIEQHRKTFEIDPTTSHLALGNAYLQQGMYEEALAAYQSSVTPSQESPYQVASLGFAYAMAGKPDVARRLLARLKQRARLEYVSPYNIATIYVGLGEADRAFEWLETAFRDQAFALVYLKVDPQMDRLRSDPRFQDMLRRLGLAS